MIFSCTKIGTVEIHVKIHSLIHRNPKVTNLSAFLKNVIYIKILCPELLQYVLQISVEPFLDIINLILMHCVRK